MCQSKLSSCVTAWEQINAPVYVLDWIKHGVPIPLVKHNISFDLESDKLDVIQSTFVNQEIKLLLLQGSVEHCNYKPVYVSPLGCVPKKNKKTYNRPQTSYY